MCAPAAIAGETYAPTPIILDVVPPGAPTVLNAGPLLPALLMNIIRCLFTTYIYKEFEVYMRYETYQ